MDADAAPQFKFKYRAFISYSRADRESAVWLHKALENYRIPPDLENTAGRDGPIPRRLFPIFRDRDELSSSSDLSQSLEEALKSSAYLIVICSPAGAKSRWVNNEIIRFIKLGRADRIHALVVAGEPEARLDDGGCFPPALHTVVAPDGSLSEDRSREILAADLRPEGDGQDDAKLKLIAGILGIPFNSLRRREVAAARRRLRITQAVAATIVILALGVGVAGWATWHFREEADERLVPGIRMELHETSLDLSGWQETSAADIANRVKKSSALSLNEYTIVRTQPQARNYRHVVGTSSLIPPDIECTCEIAPRYPDDATRAPNEFNVTFDISNVKLETPTKIHYSTVYWNAFQSADQWWAGLRVLYQTEMAHFSLTFPASRHPRQDKVMFSYFDTEYHPLDGKDVSFTLDAMGQISSLVWTIAHPSADRSYRIRWDWGGHEPPD